MADELDMDEVLERFCAAIEAIDPEFRGDFKKETADLLMVLGMAGYGNATALDIAAQLVESKVTRLSIREMTFASEFMLDGEVTHFERPEHVLKMALRDAKQQNKPVEECLIDRLAALRAKRTSVSPGTARRIIQGFEKARAKVAINESIGRRKKAFQQRMAVFSQTAEAVEAVQDRTKGAEDKPKLDSIFLRKDEQ